MTEHDSIPFFIGRIIICSIILFFIYLSYLLPKDLETESINVILYLFIIPIISIIGTIAICLLVGLPIRLIPRLYRWWIKNSHIAFIGLLVGLMIVIFSYTFTESIKVVENGIESVKEMPNQTVLEIGWFSTAFFILHFYPIRLVENLLHKSKRKKKNLDWTQQW